MRTVPDIEQNVQRCACLGCPSNPVPAGPLYCGREAPSGAVDHRGCLCSLCPVFKVYDLTGEYFCEDAAD